MSGTKLIAAIAVVIFVALLVAEREAVARLFRRARRSPLRLVAPVWRPRVRRHGENLADQPDAGPDRRADDSGTAGDKAGRGSADQLVPMAQGPPAGRTAEVAGPGQAVAIYAGHQTSGSLMAPPLLPRPLRPPRRPGSLRLAIAGGSSMSDSGRPARDAYLIQHDLMAVAQGVTATNADHMAASLALSSVIVARPQHAEQAAEAVGGCVTNANRAILAAAQRDPQMAGMAASVDVVMLDPGADSQSLIFAHVGTSAIWHFPSGGAKPRALTTRHAYRNGPPLRAAGMAPDLTPDTGTVTVKPGDRVLLGTDSLSKLLTEAELREIVTGYGLQDAVDFLIATAATRSSSNDVTAVIAEVTVG